MDNIKPMQLKEINIRLQEWGDKRGRYEATIQYLNKSGEVKLLLDNDISGALLACIGQTITEFATRAAKNLEADLALSVEASKRPTLIDT